MQGLYTSTQEFFFFSRVVRMLSSEGWRAEVYGSL